MDFSGRVVLVTGASGGIGGAIAREFAKHGAAVALHYGSNRDAAEQTLRTLSGNGHFVVQADITKPDEAARLVDEVVARAGALHVLVNNAGIFEAQPITDGD